MNRLSSLLLCTVLLQQIMSSGALTCYYCQFDRRERGCSNLQTQCVHGGACFAGSGLYGGLEVLKGKGCVDKELCNDLGSTDFRGVTYTVKYDCCRHDLCNSRSELSARPARGTLLMAVGVVLFWFRT
ncbi:protein Bouncer-like [Polyodon spathula]|uniref:protein Bouncer-like n=1 Tax=Polyodon spathula TaxID=7913 RepID=UPI001B7E8205|nr:protein Bouncer-like [Polyodon spathula]